MSNKFNEVVIISAARTPIGAYKGSLKDIKADQLGSLVIKEVINRSGIDKKEVSEVIMGQVLTAGAGQNPARQAAINAGLSQSIPAHLVNQVCGSGLRSVISGFQTLKLNEAKYVISGGQENMSLAPHTLSYRDEKILSEDRLIDTMIYDGLIDAFNNYHMGVTAENVANKYKISREEQDDFALKVSS
jgi:acetyl-CoA C-acetyltransferase